MNPVTVTKADPSVEVSQKMNAFRREIREGRYVARMSQRDLARVIGRSQRQVSFIESGERPLRLEDAVAIAAALRPALGRNILEVLSND